MTDQSVRRVGELTTTFLDTLSVLLLAAGAGWWQWTTNSPAMGLVTAGVVVMLFSLVAQWQASVKRERAKPVEDDAPPGPADSGNLHVMGR